MTRTRQRAAGESPDELAPGIAIQLGTALDDPSIDQSAANDDTIGYSGVFVV